MNKKCNWRETNDDWDHWETECDQTFYIIDGAPSHNQMMFCCFCGKPIVENPYVFSDDESDEVE